MPLGDALFGEGELLSVAVQAELRVGVGVCEGECDSFVLPDDVCVALRVHVCVARGVTVTLADGDGVCVRDPKVTEAVTVVRDLERDGDGRLGVGDGTVSERLTVRDGERLRDCDTVAVHDSDGEPSKVRVVPLRVREARDCVPVGVPVHVCVVERDRVADVAVRVWLRCENVAVAVGVRVPEATSLSERVEDPEGVAEGRSVGVVVSEGVGEAGERVHVGEGVGVMLTLADSEDESDRDCVGDVDGV